MKLATYRLLNRTVLTLIATIVASLSLVVTVSAQVPPAGRHHGTGQTTGNPECYVRASLDNLDGIFKVGNTGNSGDTILTTLRTVRYAGRPTSGKIRITIDLTPGGKVFPGEIDGSSLPNQMDIISSTDSKLVLQTHNVVPRGQTINTALTFKLKDDPTLVNPYDLGFSVSTISLNTDNTLDTTCQSNSLSAVHVAGAIQFDATTKIAAKPQYLHPNESTTITGTALNALASRSEIPVNVGYSVTMTYPSTLVLDDGLPTQPPTNTATSPVTWPGTTKANIKKNGFIGTWSATFRKPNGSGYVADHVVTFCITAPAGSWFRGHELDGGLPTGNNCSTITLHDSPLVIKKTWTDNQTVRRVIDPDATASFKITVQNVSPTTVSNLTLTDTLQRSESCNLVTTDPNVCPAWDPTANWSGTPAGATIDSTSQLHWSNLTVPANSAPLTFQVNIKAADIDTLVALMSQDSNGQDRCNKASATIPTADGDYREQSYICFNYRPPEISATKTVSSATIKQGAEGTYTIIATNSSNKVPAIGTDFTDVQTDSRQLAVWEDDAALAAKNLVVDPAHENILHSINKVTIAPQGGQYKLEPKFYAVCDAYDRTSATTRTVSNVGKFKPQNLGDEVESNTAPFEVANGHYNLTSEVTGTPNPVVPGDPVKKKIDLKIKLRNTDTKRAVDVAVPKITLTAKIPAQFSIVSAPGATVDGDTISWPIITSLGINASIEKTVSLQVGDQALRKNPADLFQVDATSISAGSTCGRAHTDYPIWIDGVDLTAAKKVESPANGIANPGDTVRFSLDLSNIALAADLNRTDPANYIAITDPLVGGFSYAGNPSCSIASRSGGSATSCSVTPTNNNNTITWKVASLPHNSTMSLKFDAKINPNVVVSQCPTPLYNSSPTNPATAKDPLDATFNTVFGPAIINIYPDQCLQGNIYARNQNAADRGIIINSDQLIIDPNTVLSAKGSIACEGNQSCIDSAYKFGQYEVSSSVGLNLDAIVSRMSTNIARVLKNADTQTNPTITGGAQSFDLYGGRAATDYPEGRVLKVAGDLTLNTTGTITFKGKGTFIICGDLKVTGDGGVKTETENASSAVGFIVLPKTNCPFGANGSGGGNVMIDGTVNKFAGVAVYAPGTNGTAIDSNSTSGVMTFAPGSGRIQPAEGIFIAREFSINRNANFRYRRSLNTPEGSPPGFTFTSSPNDTNEGR
jgi:uncharacterized repeat protein (TIGR01451 family)